MAKIDLALTLCYLKQSKFFSGTVRCPQNKLKKCKSKLICDNYQKQKQKSPVHFSGVSHFNNSFGTVWFHFKSYSAYTDKVLISSYPAISITNQTAKYNVL